MMEIIVGGRASGKTHRLIRQAIKYENAKIIVASPEEANWVEQGIFRALVDEEHVSPAHARVRAKGMVQTVFGHSSGQVSTYFVDNLEWVLEAFLGGRVKTVTENSPVETPQGKRFEPWDNNPHVRL